MGARVEVGAQRRPAGVQPSSSRVAALVVFGVAVGRWIRDGEERSPATLQEAVLDELVTLTATG